MNDIQPFRIAIDDADLEDLRDRLARTRWSDESPADGRERGIRSSELRELVEAWAGDYDWRGHEERLNRIPQFVTEIDGQRIHFLHARCARDDAPALLLTHGFPSSNVEFARLIELLTEPAPPGFHVVAPSLPGYGFSTPLSGAGWSMGRTANAWIELMRRLGYERYGVHGGDIGAGVSGMVASRDPEHVIGMHVVTDPDDGGQRGDLHPRNGGQPGCLGSDRQAHPRADGRVPQRHLRLPRDPEHAAADDRLRPDRLAGVPPRVDRREAAGLDGCRHRPRPAAHPGVRRLVRRAPARRPRTLSTTRPTRASGADR